MARNRIPQSDGAVGCLVVLLMLVGMIVGFGVWLAIFIDGINQIVDALNLDPVPSNEIAWGAAKVVVISEFVGGIVTIPFYLVAMLIASWGD